MQNETNTVNETNVNEVVNTEKKVLAENSDKAKKLLKKDAPIKKDANKDLTVLNLNQFSKQLSSMEVKLKQKKDTLYIYPENMTEADKNGDKGKKFRASLRNQIQRFANNIFVFAHPKNPQIENLKKEIKLFVAFYKANYRINDYTPESISQSDSDKAKFANVRLMLQIINEVNKK